MSCQRSLYCPHSTNPKSKGPRRSLISLKCPVYPPSPLNQIFSLTVVNTQPPQNDLALSFGPLPEKCLLGVNVILMPLKTRSSHQSNSVIFLSSTPHFLRCRPTPSAVKIFFDLPFSLCTLS